MNLRDCASASNSPYILNFSDNVAVPSGGKKAKNIAQAIFGQQIFKMELFKNGGGGTDDSGLLLGCHSTRKYATPTHAQKCGFNKDEKDTRGRCKGKG